MFSVLRSHSSLIVLLFTLSAVTGVAPQTPPVDKGQLLVATRHLDDTPFKHAVILVTEHSEKGCFGLAINHPTPVFIDDFLPSTTLKKAPASQLYQGGPKAMQILFVVAHNSGLAKMNPLTKDLYYAAGSDAAAILEHSPANAQDVRAFAGYLQFTREEIDAGIQRGDWQVLPASTENVFNSDPATLWEQMAGAWDGEWM